MKSTFIKLPLFIVFLALSACNPIISRFSMTGDLESVDPSEEISLFDSDNREYRNLHVYFRHRSGTVANPGRVEFYNVLQVLRIEFKDGFVRGATFDFDLSNYLKRPEAIQQLNASNVLLLSTDSKQPVDLAFRINENVLSRAKEVQVVDCTYDLGASLQRGVQKAEVEVRLVNMVKIVEFISPVSKKVVARMSERSAPKRIVQVLKALEDCHSAPNAYEFERPKHPLM